MFRLNKLLYEDVLTDDTLLTFVFESQKDVTLKNESVHRSN